METLRGKSNLERLPVELKMMIMQKLTKQDLSNVALVSKNLKSVALDPNLWTQITIFQSIPARRMKQMIHSPRFKKITLLKIVEEDHSGLNSEQIAPILQEIINVKSLVELDLSETNLLGVPAELLSKTISNLSKVDLYNTQLSTKQLVAICEETIKSNALTQLILTANYLQDVPPKLLSKAVSKLQKADLLQTYILPEQLVAILEETVKSNSLIELNLGRNDLVDVSTEVLSKAISKLKKANLCDANLSTVQAVSILEETIKSNSLTELSLESIYLKDVPVKVLSKAISKLEKADLDNTDLSTEQVVAIFEETMKSNSLIELNIDCFNLNLNDVPAKVLSKGVSKLKNANLLKSDLSTDQLVAILEETIKSNSLTVLSLHCINLESVPAGVLSKAISKLKEVNLHGTNLSTEQLVAVLEKTIASKSLTKLSLGGNDFEHIPPQLLSKAISKLEVVYLLESYLLSTEQYVNILEETIKSNSLIQLHFGLEKKVQSRSVIEFNKMFDNLKDVNNLKYVPKELLSKAISKLENTDLELAHLPNNLSQMEKALEHLVDQFGVFMECFF